MKIKDSAVSDALRLISAERFKEFHDTAGSRSKGVVLHQHATCVSGSLMPLIALTEIALRNAVDEALARYFNRPDWLLADPAVFPWKPEEAERIKRGKRDTQRAIYTKLTNQEKQALDLLAFPAGIPPATTHEQRAKARQRTIPVTQGKLIAQLNIYFWKRLFSTDYDHSLWRAVLKKVFPSKQITRAEVSEYLERIYVIRNRVAHHEVVLDRHLQGVMEAFAFVANNLRPINPTSRNALAQLLKPHLMGTFKKARASRDFLNGN